MRAHCPRCFLEQEVELWESVNATLNPDLREMLLNQELLRLRCQGCQGILMLGYPLLYHDMKHGCMIWFDPGREGGGPDIPFFMHDYQLRTVHSVGHLIEKILLLEARQDDRAMEWLKLRVLTTLAATHVEPLKGLGEVPLDPASLLFVGTVMVEPDSQAQRQIAFLLLLKRQIELPLFVLVAERDYETEVSRLRDSSAVEPRKEIWPVIDPAWAKRTSSAGTTPIELQLLAAPHLLERFPVAGSIFEKHVELRQAGFAG